MFARIINQSRNAKNVIKAEKINALKLNYLTRKKRRKIITKIRVKNKGFMNTHETKCFQMIRAERLKIYREYCGADKIVVDIGCHDDYHADKLEYKQLYLVDSDLKRPKTVRNNVYLFDESIISFINLNYMANKFDTIIMGNVIEHLSNVPIVFQNIHKIISPGGHLIVTFPNARSLNRMLGVNLGILFDPYQLSEDDKRVGHVKMFSPEYLGYLGQLTELKLVRSEGIMFKPLPQKLMDLYFDDILERFIEIGQKLGIKSCSHIVAVFRKDGW